jgi:PEP-CTERM motif
MRQQIFICCFVVLMFIIWGPATAKADPLLFSNVVALQDGGSTSIDLFANPGATLFGPSITFRVDISGVLPAGGMDTLLITYQELGGFQSSQSFQIPLFGSVQPPFSLVFTIISPGANLQGVSGSLTLDLLNSSPDFVIVSGPNAGQLVDSYTYSLNIAQPVPEPATALMVGSGLLGLATKLFRRNKNRIDGQN